LFPYLFHGFGDVEDVEVAHAFLDALWEDDTDVFSDTGGQGLVEVL
jgi:hypothetical protein